MTDEERRAVEAQMRADLEADHQKRLGRLGEPSPMEEAARAELARRERERVEAEVREAFYLEKGYKPYENSRGQTEWLLPEEYDKRMRRRKRDRTRPKGPDRAAGWGELALALAISLGVGVLISLVLLRG